jgi:EndoU nuclease-like protein
MSQVAGRRPTHERESDEHRGESPTEPTAIAHGALDPAALLALQRTAGNVAARSLVTGTAAGPLLQRQRFGSAKLAETWLKDQRAKNAEESDEAYLAALIDGTDYNAKRDRETNLAMLKRAWDKVKPPDQSKDSKGEKKAQARHPDRLTDKIWDHIVNGTVEGEDVTGLHTIKGPKPVAVGVGKKTYFGGFECYSQGIVKKEQPGAEKKQQPKKKPAAEPNLKKSSFYPDDWELKDIRDAIECASKTGMYYEVTIPEKGAGMFLHFNGASWYPYDK